MVSCSRKVIWSEWEEELVGTLGSPRDEMQIEGGAWRVVYRGHRLSLVTFSPPIGKDKVSFDLIFKHGHDGIANNKYNWKTSGVLC